MQFFEFFVWLRTFPHYYFFADLENFIKGTFCVLKKIVFVTAVPKGKEYLTAKKRHCKYTKYLQYIGYPHIKFNKVELIIFSINSSEIDKVILYIANQKEHHKKKTFQDE